MEIRRTRAADLPALHDIFRQAIGEVYERHAFEPPAPPLEVFAAQQEHVLAHDGERCWVAEEAGAPVAFVSAWIRGDTWFLASLFVHPSAQARGIGSALLERAWADGPSDRRTLTDAIQPVSNALYGRRGLIPVTPVLPFGGEAGARVDADALEPAEPTPDALQELDAAAYGFDRALDHEHWAKHARRTLWLRGGDPYAYTYVFPGATIGPVAGVDGVAAAAALAHELAELDGEVRVRIPGSSRGLVATALAAGLRITGPPGLLLLSSGVPAPDALAIGSYTLL